MVLGLLREINANAAPFEARNVGKDAKPEKKRYRCMMIASRCVIEG